MVDLLTNGFFASVPSYTKKAIIPINPRISGAKVLADVHGNLTPPQVRPMMTELELAIMRKFPLQQHQLPCTTPAKTRHDLHPVHAHELLAERTWRGLQMEEGDDEDSSEASEGQVKVCVAE